MTSWRNDHKRNPKRYTGNKKYDSDLEIKEKLRELNELQARRERGTQKEIPARITVDSRALFGLKITVQEYLIGSSIFKLQNNSVVSGWCYCGKEHLANTWGFARTSVHNHIKSLVKKGLVEINPVTRHLRVTNKWRKEVEFWDKKADEARRTLRRK